MVDQVRTNLRVAAGAGGEQDLGADPVGTGDQHRLAVARGLEGKQPAERPHAGQHLGALGGLGERLDQLDRSIPGVDVDAGITVACHVSAASRASLSISSCTGTGTG